MSEDRINEPEVNEATSIDPPPNTESVADLSSGASEKMSIDPPPNTES